MRTIKTLIALLIIAAAAGAVFVWSGVYNISAMVPHWPATFWVLGEVRDRSIINHSKNVSAPALDEAMAEEGFVHYHETCRLCHEAPGYDRAEFAKGLYPRPPKLTDGDVQGEWSAAQIFWIAKNGLKMTGMPAFGKNHDDQNLWRIVAFVEQVPKVDPEQYKAMVEKHGADQH